MKPVLYFCLFILLIGLASATECYQETANVSTPCGGYSTGSYSFQDASSTACTGDYGCWDFDWDETACNSYNGCSYSGGSCLGDSQSCSFYNSDRDSCVSLGINGCTWDSTDGKYFMINYTRPPSAVDGTIWQIKHGDSEAIYNVSVPYSCFNNTDSDTVELRFFSRWFLDRENSTFSWGECYNGTWNNITNIYATDSITEGTTSNVGYLYDGIWDTGAGYLDGSEDWLSDVGYGDSIIYEEGIYWNISGEEEEEDLILPTASIFTPLNNSYLSNNPNILALASDDVAMDYVFFQYQNGTAEWVNLTGCENVVTAYNCTINASEFEDENTYYIRVIPVDTSGNTNWWTLPFTYYIDLNRPHVDFPTTTYPTSQTIARNGQQITLTVNITDAPLVSAGIAYVEVDLSDLNGSGLSNMTFIDGNLSARETSVWQLNVTLNTANTYDPFAAIPVFLPRIYAYDNATPVSNVRSSETFQVYIDNTAPTLLELYTPLNPPNGTEINISATASDNYNVSEMILFYNFNDTDLNQTFVTSGVSVSNSFNETILNGTWTYYWQITDEAGNVYTEPTQIIYSGFLDENLTVGLMAPEPEYSQFGLNINFTYNASGNSIVDYCDLYANDNLWDRQFSPAKDTNISVSIDFLEFGDYEWYVNCTDTLTKTYSSEIWNFTLTDDIPPNITIFNPTENEDFNNFISTIEIFANFSVTESNLDSCWYSLDGQNTTISCTANEHINFTFEMNYSGIIFMEIFANDTSGAIGSANRTFSITDYIGPRTGLSGGGGAGNGGVYYALDSGYICNQTYQAILEHHGNLSFTEMEIDELSQRLTILSNTPITSDVLKEYLYNFREICTDYALSETIADVRPTLWMHILEFIKWLAYLIYPYNFYIGISLLILLILLIIFRKQIFYRIKSVKVRKIWKET